MAAILRSVLDEIPPSERNLMVLEDLRAEADTLDDTIFLLENTNLTSSEDRLRQNLAVAAEGSLDANTFKNYQRCVILVKAFKGMLTYRFFCRIWSKLTDYCVQKGFIATKNAFDSGPIPPAAPDYFALFIAHEFVSNMSFSLPDY